MSVIKIGNQFVGEGQPSFVIAEIAQAHDGSLGMAHSFIDAAAETGVDAVKFQTHIASAESTKDEVFRIPMSGQDQTRYDYWKRMEFTAEQWLGLQKHAREKGVLFLSSAFSVEAVTLLKKLGIEAWKVGSGEFRSLELLDAMAEEKKPILYSTGMSTYADIDQAVTFLRGLDVSYGLFQCTSKYPTSLEDVGLNVLLELRNKYDCPVGLSDHSGQVFPSLSAIAMGADMIEVHVTFDKRMYGPDASASITFGDLQLLMKARDAHHAMMVSPVNKDEMAADLHTMRNLFTKSIGVNRDLPAGTVLDEQMLVPKKPGTGIAFSARNNVIGRTLVRDVSMECLLREEDFK